MVLEVKKLLIKGEYSGEFSFEVQPDSQLMLIPLCSFKGPLKVHGTYEIFEDGEVEIALNLSYRIVGSCSYCLADAEKLIDYSAPVVFTTDKNDLDNYFYDGIKIDLSAAVNDALLFSQPKVLLCKEDCKG